MSRPKNHLHIRTNALITQEALLYYLQQKLRLIYDFVYDVVEHYMKKLNYYTSKLYSSKLLFSKCNQLLSTTGTHTCRDTLCVLLTHTHTHVHSHEMTQTHMDDDSNTHKCITVVSVNLCDRAVVFTTGRGRHTMFPARVENTVSWTW